MVVALLTLLGVTASCRSGQGAAPATTSTTVSEADKRLQQGLANQEAGALDKAREDFLAVISQDPTNKVAYYDLGVVAQQQNDVDAAADAYRKALDIDPQYQPALFNLAVLLAPVEPETAVDLYRKLLAINPNDANVHFNLGLLLRQMGRQSEGNTEVARALELKPELASRLPATTAPTSTSSTARRR